MVKASILFLPHCFLLQSSSFRCCQQVKNTWLWFILLFWWFSLSTLQLLFVSLRFPLIASLEVSCFQYRCLLFWGSLLLDFRLTFCWIGLFIWDAIFLDFEWSLVVSKYWYRQAALWFDFLGGLYDFVLPAMPNLSPSVSFRNHWPSLCCWLQVSSSSPYNRSTLSLTFQPSSCSHSKS